MSSYILEVTNLTRRYGIKVALDNVSIKVKAGAVFGLIGENGSGKTTLLKHLVGLLSVQQGSVRVFGKDPVRNPVEVLSRIGYLSEEDDLPSWMRVRDLTAYVQSFYPSWDNAYFEQLRLDFGINPKSRVKELSKGQKTRVNLIFALAYRPDLLLLDEPSSGLDPIVRRDLLNAIVQTISKEGRTVFFSSHSLHEVEQTCDHVAMIRNGALVFCDTLQHIKESHFRINFNRQPGISGRYLPGTTIYHDDAVGHSIIYSENLKDFQTAVNESAIHISTIESASLEEIFMAYSNVALVSRSALSNA